MIQKIKKPVSILLTVLMVFSVFAVVPFAASAATYDSGDVNLSNLRVGDIITAYVDYVEIGGCTVVLKGGRYGEGYADMGRLISVCPDDRESSRINIRSTNGNFEIMDMNTWGLFVPVDQNGEFANKLIVLAKEENKITIGGYSEADTPEPLNSSVKYRYYNGEYFRNGNTPADNTYKVVSGNKKWTNGNWYVVTEDVTISERITTSGDVNLVLCDGAKLTAEKGISVNINRYNPNQTATLNIYSQSGGTGTLFAGTIDGTNTTMPRRPENAAIGGNDSFQNGSITIHGGNITAIANAGAAGIGGGQSEPCSTVTVYGGNVTAGCTGGYGSGIGGGYYAENGSVNVAGGHVIAYGLGGEQAAAIGNMAENINLTVADGSEIKAGTSASDAAVVASSNDALKKVYVEINAPALPQAYDITWKMDDGSILKTKEFVAGTTPTYDGENPTKTDGECCTYTFHGWNDSLRTYTGTLPAVTEDTTFTAVFNDAPKDGYYKTTTGGHSVYSIVPLGDDVDGGETKPEFIGGSDGENFRLTSLKNCKYNYYSADGTNLGASFSKSVDGDYSVVVTSDSMPKIVLVKPVYTISWNNWDGTPAKMLGTDVIHGETPVYDGTEPTKPADDTNTYTFTGWDPKLARAYDNATYTAKFDATPNAFVASVTSNGTTTKYADFSDALNAWVDGSTLTLLSNVENGGRIFFDSGVKTLDLNGYGIKNTSTNYEASNSVIYIRGSGTQLTLQDSRPNETTHYFTAPAGNAGLATDISDIDSGDQQSFHGGYLTGGNCFSGGGIRVDNGANLIMTGGTIIGNRGRYGGGIDVEQSGSAGGSATISGGAIMYNYGWDWNGAIHTNHARYLSVSNCRITNNYAQNGAGAVYKSSVSDGFSGNMVVKDNKTGNNECNIVLGDNERISLSSALGDDAYIGITMSNPGVFTNSAETANNDASKFKSDDASYTVGKNADGQLYLYKSLIAGHSITLDGNIGINFYIDPSAAGLNPGESGTITANFDWTIEGPRVEVSAQSKTVNVTAQNYTRVGDRIKVTCYVCAAEMSCKVKATFNLKNESQTEEYCVRDYCAELLNPNSEASVNYKNTHGAEKYGQLTDLVTKMLDYGTKAQGMFEVNTSDPANTLVPTYSMQNVTEQMFKDAVNKASGTDADNIASKASAFGAKYYATSLFYYKDNKLRHYFIKDENGSGFNPSSYDGNQDNYFYYVEVPEIAPAKLDSLQTFTVGTTSFKYAALDYARNIVYNSNVSKTHKDLAKALYWYNKAANVFFNDAAHTHTSGAAVRENEHAATCTAAGSYDEVVYCTECGAELSRAAKTIDMLAHTIVAVAEVPATTEADGVAAHYECSVCGKLFTDAEGNNETTAEALVIPQIVENVVDLSTLERGYEAQDGDVLINALDGQKYIRIADGATVKLRNANITCLRNSSSINIAGLTLLGDATIILEGTNTIRGGYEYCPGIHVPEGKTLTIDGTGSLDVSSNGRGFGCGIGSNDGTNCGNIVINGGNITAYAGTAAGIGAKSGSSCGNITINGGTVNATSGDYGAGIGSTLYGNSICGDITINGGVVNATANYEGPGIGSGTSANCGNITITGGTVTAIGGEEGAGIGTGNNVSICGNILITGGTVIAKGGNKAAGIGSGYRNTTCGTITIADTVTQVTATKGTDAPNSIGAGDSGSCGTVTIAPGANVTQN